MIRRAVNGQARNEWLLISQIEHARIAGEIAMNWGRGVFSQPVVPDVLIPAIIHHDDGWHEWDAAPKLDTGSGVPIAFDEMATEDANEIWAESINMVAQFGCLAQYAVARHFLHLRISSRATSRTTEGRRFIDQFEPACDQWLKTWLAESPSNSRRLAQTVVQQLRFFDNVSLSICLSDGRASWGIPSPDGIQVTFIPTSLNEFRISPWPLSCDNLNLQVQARRVLSESDDKQSKHADVVNTLLWRLHA